MGRESSDGPVRGGRALRWVIVPLGIGLASRAWAIAAIAWANQLRPDPFGNPFVVWDALWYVSIARSGYHANPIADSLRDIAFFPGWPMLLRLATPPGWPIDVIAPALANGLFILACVILWQVLADRLGGRVATPAIAFLAFSPAAYAGSFAYNESLFLVLAGSAFLLRGRTIARAIAVAAAVATRVAGAALVLLELVQSLGARGRERVRHLSVAAAGLAAFGAWWLYLAWLTHDPVGFLRGSPNWPGETGVDSFVQALSFHEAPQAVALGIWLVLVGASIVVLRRDRELGLYALTVLAMTVLPGGLVSSSPRYALSAFPAFAGLALVLRGRWAWLGLAALAALELLFTYWVLVERRAP
jgi:hypothetical protein